MDIGQAIDATDIYISPDVQWVRVICCPGDGEEVLKTADDFVWRFEEDWRVLTLEEIREQITRESLFYVWADEALLGYIYKWNSDCGWILHGKTMGYA